ncbi:MAG: DUF2161 domain-containing phosphodiesterase, partial [Rhodospirillales bacterium]|nr:DUF2161 domain-containing phosphodiesterase [Rhodospirillales bacterium]
NNVYGWFVRVERGIYGLTDLGRSALIQWADGSGKDVQVAHQGSGAAEAVLPGDVLVPELSDEP